jgi:hypothetical protein
LDFEVWRFSDVWILALGAFPWRSRWFTLLKRPGEKVWVSTWGDSPPKGKVYPVLSAVLGRATVCPTFSEVRNNKENKPIKIKPMKKLIALTALAGLLAAGCANRDRNTNSGGTSDTSSSSYGTSSSATNQITDPNATKSGTSSTKDSQPDNSNSSNSSKDNSSSPTPQ